MRRHATALISISLLLAGCRPDATPRTHRFVRVEREALVEDLEPIWGASWPDVDGDGRPDLFLSGHMTYRSTLYMNRDGLSFQPSDDLPDSRTGLDDHASSWADFNGDGRIDVFSANGFFVPSFLLANTGGGFTDVIGRVDGYHHGRYRSAVWTDLNGDGWDDLAISSWESPDQLLLSRGAGRLEETGESSGFRNSIAKNGYLAADIDGDGDIDLVGLGTASSLVYVNRGDGSFEETSGLQKRPVSGTMGDAGDIDGDGDIDLVTSRAIYLNDGKGAFADARPVPLSGEIMATPNLADLDNDGDLDILFHSTGYDRSPVARAHFFRNDGPDGFSDQSAATGLDFSVPGIPNSAAFADYNGDGAVDVLLTNGNDGLIQSGGNVLIENRNSPGRSLRVFPERDAGSRDGFGATVRAATGVGRLVRATASNRLYAQDQVGVHLGLGDEGQAGQICAEWPDGGFSCRQGVPAGFAILPAGPHPVLVDSHPAALLLERPAIDLSPVRRFLEENGEPLRKADPDDLQRRQDRLLAHVRAAKIREGITVGPAEEKAFRSTMPGFTRPARIWLESLVYEIALFPREQLVDEAAKTFERLGGRESVYQIAKSIHLHSSKSEDPSKRNHLEGVRRGYVEIGWVPVADLERRLPASVAARLREAPSGARIGVIEHEDVRRPGGRAVLSAFLVGPRQPAEKVRLPERSDDVRRAIARRKLSEALGDAARPDPALRPSDTGIIEGLRYSIPKLAAEARRANLTSDPAVERAFRRIEEESMLSASLVAWAERPDAAAKPAGPIKTHKRFKGLHFYFTTRPAAEGARKAFAAGATVDEVARRFQARTLEKLSGRFHNQYIETFNFDAPILARRIGHPNLKIVEKLRPGGLTGVLEFGNAFHIIRLDGVADVPSTTRELMERRARFETRRSRLLRASELLAGPPGR